jgi:protocatechuate 3,4-dioxygenase beta subunit
MRPGKAAIAGMTIRSHNRRAFGSRVARRALCLVACAAALLAVAGPRGASAGASSSSRRPQNGDARVATAAGRITGRVTTDAGRPVADALIYVRRAGVASMHTTATDEDGRFRTDELPAGAYSVVANAPGYVLPEQEVERAQSRVYRPGDSVSITLAEGGVITGRVTDERGQPVVAVGVRSVRVADAEGRPARGLGFAREQRTDDRGVYRIYGLEAGVYLVEAGGGSQLTFPVNHYEYDAPTFYPSATRETAAEIKVERGLEVSGIDIRYRGERGHVISGRVTSGLPAGDPVAITLALAYTGSGTILINKPVLLANRSAGFVLAGVPEGDFDLVVRAGAGSDEAAYALRRLKVSGAGTTNLDIALTPFASASGRVELEPLDAAQPPAGCTKGAQFSPEAFALVAERDDAASAGGPFGPLLPGDIYVAADERREFTLRNLTAGLYRLAGRLSDEGWYVKSLTLTPAAPARVAAPAAPASSSTSARGAASPAQVAAQRVAAADVAGAGLSVKAGERLGGLLVTLAEGAASLRGRVAAGEGAGASRARVHLVPAERGSAADVLRYAEADAAADGTFALANLAPGRYFVLARAAADTNAGAASPKSARADARARAELRREAEARNQSIELRQCQRVTEYSVPLGAAPAPRPE